MCWMELTGGTPHLDRSLNGASARTGRKLTELPGDDDSRLPGIHPPLDLLPYRLSLSPTPPPHPTSSSSTTQTHLLINTLYHTRKSGHLFSSSLPRRERVQATPGDVIAASPFTAQLSSPDIRRRRPSSIHLLPTIHEQTWPHRTLRPRRSLKTPSSPSRSLSTTRSRS